VKLVYDQVVLVDNGGFFPEIEAERDKAWFLMDAMKVLGTDAVGVGDRDLKFGLAFLKAQVKRTQLPMVSSNLLDKKSKKPVFPPYVIKKNGGGTIGIFSLMSEKADLGPARDSLAVAEPSAVAKQVVTDLRKKGATTVILLSQLGKVESEDLVSAVDGIDAVMVGHDVPLIQKGRMVKNTTACYGGEQGQYICRTELTLDAKKHVTSGDAEAIILGPEVGEKPEVAKLVKSFEDGFNEKMRKTEMERAASQEKKSVENSPDHYLGAELCIRCHAEEGAQWKTTSHSMAWQTLVEVKKDATPECIPCHVVGYNKPGGFVSAATTPQLGNVQCENCHGMGTQHEAFASTPAMITDKTCVTCHHGENDPEFSFDKKLAMIAHSNLSGDTIKNRKLNKTNPNMMKGSHGSP
jgi:hypothetical protein